MLRAGEAYPVVCQTRPRGQMLSGPPNLLQAEVVCPQAAVAAVDVRAEVEPASVALRRQERRDALPVACPTDPTGHHVLEDLGGALALLVLLLHVADARRVGATAALTPEP